MSDQIKVGRRAVKVTNRDKVLFPQDGVTKGDLIAYYRDIAPVMLPYLKDRPVTLERFPDGIEAERIYQKNIAKYFPEWVARATVRKRGGTVTHVLANDAGTLVYLANLACITPHVWLSTAAEPQNPDQLIFDLDPSTQDFDQVRATALRLKDVLEQAGLVPFVKTSGSKGLHVVCPLRPTEPFEVVYDLAEAIAVELIRQTPDLLTLEFHKADRGARILLDVRRNAYAQTAVAPWAVRARPGAPVAVPLRWDEVSDPALRPNGFSMSDALERAGGPDPWAGFRRAARSARRAREAYAAALHP